MSTSGEGWFADPQDQRQLRWWTGTEWTERTRPRVGPSHWGPPLKRSWFGLGTALQIALGTSFVASAFTLYVDLETLAFVEDVRLRPDTVTPADAARIDRLTIWTLTEALTLLVTGVMFMAWLYTLHQSARMDRRVLEHGSGWAIGGWLVPILSFWRPFQMINDVRRGATGSRTVDVSRRQGWWWGLWVAFAVSSVVVNRLYARADATPPGPEYAYALGAAASFERYSCVASMVAAVLAIAVVREITALVREPVQAA